MLLLTALLACDMRGGATKTWEAACEPTLTEVDASDATLGFSADEVALLVAGNLPETVSWSEMSEGDTSTDLSVSLLPSGAPSIAEFTEEAGCYEPRTVLRVPVAMELSFAGGEVIASGPVDLDARALDLAYIEIDTDWNLPAELSGTYADQLDAAWDREWGAEGFTLDGVWVTLGRTWAEPVVDIEVQGTSDDAGLAATVWRGSWTLHTLAVEDCEPTYGDHCSCEPQCLTAAQIEIVQAEGVCDLGCPDIDWTCTVEDGSCTVAAE